MKKFFISFLIIFSVLLLSFSSYASSFNFTLTPNESSVKPGDEISITLTISDINAGQYGINAVETTLVYDSTIIENVEFIDKNNWKSTYNNNEGTLHGKLLYSKMVTGVKDDEVIGILKFKIKEDLQPFETEIKLLQVTSNDGFELINNGDKIIKLKYTTSNSEQINHTEEDNKIQKEPESPKQEEQNPIIEIPSKIIEQVQTGDMIVIVILILILAIFASIILFIIKKNQKNNNSKK